MSETRPPSLLAVGSVAIDWVITPWAEREESIGGSATFFAMAASYFSNVRLVGVVGKDFPAAALADIKARGVDTDGLEIVRDGLTFRWKGKYAPNMNERETLDTQLGVFAEFEPKLPAHYADSDYLFLANIQPSLQLKVLEQLQGPKLVGLDTMNLWIDTALDDLKAGDRQDRRADDQRGGGAAAQRGAQHRQGGQGRPFDGPQERRHQRGEYGALLFPTTTSSPPPALPLEEVVDPTGAGRRLRRRLHGLSRPRRAAHRGNLRTAMIYGSVLASHLVEGFSYDGIRALDIAAIQRRFDAFARLTDFSSGRSALS